MLELAIKVILANKLGQDIDGESSYNLSGYSVSLSVDGKIVAIGATYNDGNGTNSGHTRVYQLDEIANPPVWNQLGQDIDGEVSNDQSGYSVSLSANGKTIAIGAVFNDGQKRVSLVGCVYMMS